MAAQSVAFSVLLRAPQGCFLLQAECRPWLLYREPKDKQRHLRSYATDHGSVIKRAGHSSLRE